MSLLTLLSFLMILPQHYAYAGCQIHKNGVQELEGSKVVVSEIVNSERKTDGHARFPGVAKIIGEWISSGGLVRVIDENGHEAVKLLTGGHNLFGDGSPGFSAYSNSKDKMDFEVLFGDLTLFTDGVKRVGYEVDRRKTKNKFNIKKDSVRCLPNVKEKRSSDICWTDLDSKPPDFLVQFNQVNFESIDPNEYPDMFVVGFFHGFGKDNFRSFTQCKTADVEKNASGVYDFFCTGASGASGSLVLVRHRNGKDFLVVGVFHGEAVRCIENSFVSGEYKDSVPVSF